MPPNRGNLGSMFAIRSADLLRRLGRRLLRVVSHRNWPALRKAPAQVQMDAVPISDHRRRAGLQPGIGANCAPGAVLSKISPKSSTQNSSPRMAFDDVVIHYRNISRGQVDKKWGNSTRCIRYSFRCKVRRLIVRQELDVMVHEVDRKLIIVPVGYVMRIICKSSKRLSFNI